jgi:hypothetical protein
VPVGVGGEGLRVRRGVYVEVERELDGEGDEDGGGGTSKSWNCCSWVCGGQDYESPCQYTAVESIESGDRRRT